MISIIIPTFNEESFLPKLLLSIERQTYKDVEIIIADANSTDTTRAIAEKFNCIIVDGGQPSAGRNAGAVIAKGEYLLFLDADVILPEEFLEKTLEEFDENFYELATTQVFPLSDLNIDQLFFYYCNAFYKTTNNFFPFMPGSCVFVTERMHRRIGGFDESLTVAEDHDYATRAIKFGKYGVCTSSNIWVSVRRLEKEGRLNLINKYLLTNLPRLFAIKGATEKKEEEYDPKAVHTKDLNKVEVFLEKFLDKAANKQTGYKKFRTKVKAKPKK
ncbi:MAG: glycosyltransferase [bacterium]